MPISHLPLGRLLSSTDPADFSARRALSDVSLAIAKSKRVVVVSGAGISCSSGIPDFRSADGLYALVKKQYPDAFFTGRDLFSSGLFQNPLTTSIFYTFIAELSLSCTRAQPTRTHHFIHRLEQKGKLLRSYTQNVDGLERRIGLESGGRGKGLKKKGTRNVELHGDLGRVRCVLCMKDFEAMAEWVEMFRIGEAPPCPACEERCESRVSRAARPLPIGSLRPSIVLYDEPHPLGDDIGQLQAYDLTRAPDMLLIMGTSLKVHGLKRLVKEFAKAVHARRGVVVYVNATAPSKEWEGVIDVHVQGETDRWVERVEEEWRRLKPADWETQTLLDAEVVPVASTSASRGKGKGKLDTLQPVQLPTPRSSQSPQRHGNRDSSPVRENITAIPANKQPPPAAPPTPLSPSKRRANVSPTLPGSTSPAKRAKPVQPPITGIPGTPGRGNLFASPPHTNTEWLDESREDEITGIVGTPKTKAGPKGRKGRKTPASGKENAAPSPSPRRVLAIPKTRARKPPSARGRKPLGSTAVFDP